MNTSAAVLLKANDFPKTAVGRHLNAHWPLWIWTMVLLLVNLPLVWGQVRTGLIFSPHAVASGEWWRVVTYPLVHLSWYHLLLDAGGFLLLYGCLEEKRSMMKALYIIGPGVGALGVSIAMAPAIGQLGLCGLSGIAHGLMAVSAMEMIRHKDQRRWGMLSLGVVVAKSTYELLSGQVLFEFMHMGLCGRPLAASHAGGVVGGLFSYGVMHASIYRTVLLHWFFRWTKIIPIDTHLYHEMDRNEAKR